jgi:cytochrome P450/NADPH-cytochrome P450 reductase
MGKPLPPGLVPIPRPSAYPVLGNVLDIDMDDPIGSIVQLHKKHGAIMLIRFPTQTEIMVGSQELVHELCDQERFEKTVAGALEEVRTIGGDGEWADQSYD